MEIFSTAGISVDNSERGGYIPVSLLISNKTQGYILDLDQHIQANKINHRLI